MADVVNTTLDLDTTLRRVAELVRKVIDYEIFAILLLNEKAQELRIRFQVGYAREIAERIKVKIGEGVTGMAAQRREAILVDDVSKHPDTSRSLPNVRSELAVPLIVKNRVIGVINLEAPGARPLYRGTQAPVDADRFAHGGRHRECPALHAHHSPGPYFGVAE